MFKSYEFKIFISSLLISSAISSNSKLERYLSAVSASIHKITDPGLAFLATSIATANVEPPEIPVNIPSSAANFCDHIIPS